jgi:hypothetical protein
MPEPFLTYLTVFQSRLGLLNLVLNVTGPGRQPEAALLRKLRDEVTKKETVDLNEGRAQSVLGYLEQKGLVTQKLQEKDRARYKGLVMRKEPDGRRLLNAEGGEVRQLGLFLVDSWLVNPGVPSTIAVPTEENVAEVLNLSYLLRVLFRSKNNWTPAGHTIRSLRSPPEAAPDDTTANPFLIRGEWAALLRQFIEVDGVLLRELLRELVSMPGRVTRDEVALRFRDIVQRAVDSTDNLSVSPVDRRKTREFALLIEKTAAKRKQMSRAPGVLEHRVSPRLEWLVDLGYLHKDPEQRNAFSYEVGEGALDLLRDLDMAWGEPDLAESVAIRQWITSDCAAKLHPCVPTEPFPQAMRSAYRMLRPRIGPVALNELAFVTSLLSAPNRDFSPARDEILEWARSTDGINIGRGRYARSSLTIHISDDVLEV